MLPFPISNGTTVTTGEAFLAVGAQGDYEVRCCCRWWQKEFSAIKQHKTTACYLWKSHQKEHPNHVMCTCYGKLTKVFLGEFDWNWWEDWKGTTLTEVFKKMCGRWCRIWKRTCLYVASSLKRQSWHESYTLQKSWEFTKRYVEDIFFSGVSSIAPLILMIKKYL